jgi:hypothetical protein
VKHRTVALGLAAVLVGGTAVAAQIVSADPFAQTTRDQKDARSGTIPADLVETYCIGETAREQPLPDDPEAPQPPPKVERFSAAARGAIHERMRNLDAQTRYQVLYTPACGSRTDIKFVPGDDEIYGAWSCDVFVPGADLCQRGTIELSQQVFGPEFEANYGVNGLAQFQKTACHEIGHAVGLAHEPNDMAPFDPADYDDCMQSGALRKDPQRTYNAHHVEHINSQTPRAN